MDVILRIEGVTKTYQGIVALSDVSLEIERGAIVGLIGPNGSGKSTLFDCISGFQRPDRGTIMLEPRDGRARPLGEGEPARVARLGLRRTFQQPSVFPRLSVRANLMTAAQSGPGFPVLAQAFRTGSVRAHERRIAEHARALLTGLALDSQTEVMADALSFGQKKLVELSMALMGEPQLLLLDEPIAGINPTLAGELKRHLLKFRDSGTTLFVVEHNLAFVFEICDRIYVLDRGEILAAGSPLDVADDPRVMAAYLGATATRAQDGHA
jgi:ABC-type branched-subunit amino acid transport system ATPase component